MNGLQLFFSCIPFPFFLLVDQFLFFPLKYKKPQVGAASRAFPGRHAIRTMECGSADYARFFLRASTAKPAPSAAMSTMPAKMTPILSPVLTDFAVVVEDFFDVEGGGVVFL